MFLASTNHMLAADWKPVSPELLALKTPKVDPAADAEAIFWEVTVDDFEQGNYANHRVQNYLRMKLYNKRAIDKYGTVEIPYFNELRMTIASISARTIKPDGTIIDLKQNQIFDSTVQKTGKKKVQIKKFAFPGMEEGAIVEYQWTEVFTEFLARYVKLVMQREIPVWNTTYYVKPLSHPGFSGRMHSYPFNFTASPWKPVQGDARRTNFVMTSLENIPALKREPYMPHEDDVQAWMLLYYTEDQVERVGRMDKYWKTIGGRSYDSFKKQVKVSNEIRQTSAEITKDETGVANKASVLCNWVQANILNVGYNSEGMTNEKRMEFFKKPDRNQNAVDTFKNRIGTSEDILALFAAMLQSIGIEPLLLRASSANGALFRVDLPDPYLLRNRLIAVKDGDKTTYYNPTVPYLRPGMADYDEQGQAALLADNKDSQLVMIPPSPPLDSRLDRKAKLRLDEEGTVTGTVSMLYSGHLAVQEKLDLQSMADAEREESVKKDMEKRFPGAQISNVKIENANKVGTLLKVSFDLTLENFGQKTGKRMFFQPGFFHIGEMPKLPEAKRVHNLAFPFAYQENDEVEIEFPDAMELENAEMPGKINLGKIGAYSHMASVFKNKPGIVAKRELSWGANGMIYFDAKYYPQIKEAWDALHKSDTHSLTLRSK